MPSVDHYYGIYHKPSHQNIISNRTNLLHFQFPVEWKLQKDLELLESSFCLCSWRMCPVWPSLLLSLWLLYGQNLLPLLQKVEKYFIGGFYIGNRFKALSQAINDNVGYTLLVTGDLLIRSNWPSKIHSRSSSRIVIWMLSLPNVLSALTVTDVLSYSANWLSTVVMLTTADVSFGRRVRVSGVILKSPSSAAKERERERDDEDQPYITTVSKQYDI